MSNEADEEANGPARVIAWGCKAFSFIYEIMYLPYGQGLYCYWCTCTYLLWILDTRDWGWCFINGIMIFNLFDMQFLHVFMSKCI